MEIESDSKRLLSSVFDARAAVWGARA